MQFINSQITRGAAQPGGPWPTPKPLSGALANAPQFDPELLPERLRPWVVDLAERFQVPADFPAAAVIGMLAGAIGRRALIRPKRYDDWVVFGNLWGAIVGRSGLMKSPIINAVMRPLRRRQALQMALYESEWDDYQRLMAEHGARKRTRSRTAPSLGRVRSSAELDAETPQEPICTRYLVNDVSVEMLHILLKQNPQGVLLLRDELSGWMAQLDRPGRARERAFLLEAWAGNGEFTFDRIHRGTVHASSLCLSVFGALQPAPLQKYVADLTAGNASDDGLLQRFQLLVWPDVSPDWQDVDRPPDSKAERRVESVVDRVLGISVEDPFRAHFGSAAQEFFSGWRHKLEQTIRRGDLPPALESHLGKYRSLLPKLALIFHLADDEHGSGEIPLVEAERAAKFCAYLKGHAQRTYGSAAGLPQRLAAALAARLQRGMLGGRFHAREIYQHAWTGLNTPDRVGMALQVLVNAGWLRKLDVRPGASGGRPTEEFILNPAIEIIDTTDKGTGQLP